MHHAGLGATLRTVANHGNALAVESGGINIFVVVEGDLGHKGEGIELGDGSRGLRLDNSYWLLVIRLTNN